MSDLYFAKWDKRTQLAFYRAAIKDISKTCEEVRAAFYLVGGNDLDVQLTIEGALEYLRDKYLRAHSKESLKENIKSNGL